ncbi:hypothetical protein V6N13_080047 [Hibiscus sabdariffa]
MVELVSESKHSGASNPSALPLDDFPPLGGGGAHVTEVDVVAGVEVTAAGEQVPAPVSSNQGWKALFSGLPLYFHAPVEVNGKQFVQPPREVMDLGARQWDNTLSGNFLGKSPPLSVFQRTINKLWGREGSIELRFLASSVYLISFPSQRVSDWVLESGPWHVQQKALILRRWLPELYSQKGLGYLASAVGKPLYTDRSTAMKLNLEYAKEGAKSVGASSGNSAGLVCEMVLMLGLRRVLVLDEGVPSSDHGGVISPNKFDALCDVVEEQIQVATLRPCRVVATGVADLMEKLKPKEKLNKKNGKGKGRGKEKGSRDETRVQASNVVSIVLDKFSGWVFLNNYYVGSNGHIWVLIRGSWQLKDVLIVTSQVITCCLQRGDDSFVCSFVYASDGREDRVDLWRDLVAIKPKFNKENFSGISQGVLEIKIELGNVQNLMMSEPTLDCVRREKELRYELSVLEKAEENFYQQKSRAQFIREEDKNSAYFFRKVVVRQKRNTVALLV